MTTGPSSGGEGKAAQAAGAGPPTQVRVPRDAALAHGAFALVAAGGLAAMGWQVLHRPASVGAHDWNYFFQVYEAVRLSILRYGQFPWWNIWCCGGVPLFANPQVGLFSINGVMVLLFGTVLGLKLSLVAHMLFGFEGMRRLLRRYVGAGFALFGALIYVAGGGFAMHWTVGHVILLTAFYLPWLLLLALRLPEKGLYGWLFGLLMGLMVLEGVGYTTVFNILVASIAACCVLAQGKGMRLVIAGRIATAVGVFLVVAGFRLGMSMLYVSQYSGTASAGVAGLGPYVAKALFVPISDIYYSPSSSALYWWECGCYIGLPVAALFAFSLLQGRRYWHYGALLALLCALSATSPASPSYWLRMLPMLASLCVVTRWCLVALLFIGLGAAVGGEALWLRMERRWMRRAVLAFCVAAALQVVWVSADTMSVAFPEESSKPGVALPPQFGRFYRVRPSGVGYFDWVYQATRVNVGVVKGYEPLLGRDRRRPTRILAVGDAGYFGEAATSEGPLEPAYWSPNRLVFEHVSGPLRLNLAPGSYWRVNGSDVFAGMRVTELTEPFVAMPDQSGRVVLTTVPSGWRAGMALVCAGLALLGCLAVVRRFGGRREARRAAAPGPARGA